MLRKEDTMKINDTFQYTAIFTAREAALEGTDKTVWTLVPENTEGIGYFADNELAKSGSKSILLSLFVKSIEVTEEMPLVETDGKLVVPRKWYIQKILNASEKVLDYDFKVIFDKSSQRFFYINEECTEIKPVSLIAAMKPSNDLMADTASLYGLFDNFCCGEHIDANGTASYMWFRD